MPALTKIKPETEKELHGIIEKEIEALEEGLVVLKYEFALGKGTPDFVCVDSGGRLVIIEVKLQEDENILFQALGYFNEIDKQRYVVAKMFSDKKIDPDEHPRIILIAEKFSDDLRRLSTLVVPEIELYEYSVLSLSDGSQGICYHPVSLPKIEELPTKQTKIENFKEYITKDSLKPLFDDIIKKVISLGKGIEDYSTQGYVGFKYKGRQIAWLAPQRKSFDVGVVVIDEDAQVIKYESMRIETGSENYADIIEKIKKTYETLGGNAK